MSIENSKKADLPEAVTAPITGQENIARNYSDKESNHITFEDNQKDNHKNSEKGSEKDEQNSNILEEAPKMEPTKANQVPSFEKRIADIRSKGPLNRIKQSMEEKSLEELIEIK
jgi:hypothetical protein